MIKLYLINTHIYICPREGLREGPREGLREGPREVPEKSPQEAKTNLYRQITQKKVN
jgi:hypothetical protein